MSLPEQLARAQTGDVQAMAELIGQSLGLADDQVQVRWQGTQLQLRLELSKPVECQRLVHRLRQGFQRLNLTCPLSSVRVQCNQIESAQPVWVETFSLDDISSTPPSSELVEPPKPAPSAAPPQAADAESESPNFPMSDGALMALVHLMPLFSYVLLLGDLWIQLPWFWGNTFLLPWRIVAPLILLLAHGQEEVKHSAREALNFQISMLIYWLVTLALMRLVVGFLLVLPLALLETIMVIRAAVRVSEGGSVRYPFCIRWVP